MTTKGIDFQAINYLEEPLSAHALKQLLSIARLRPQDALRKNEAAYQEYVAGKDLSDDSLLHVMAAHPELIQRPIVTLGDKAVLARPLERLSNLGIELESDR